MVAAGTKYALYNAFLGGNPHASRLLQKIEDIYHEVVDDEDRLPEAKKYIRLTVGGDCIGVEDTSFQMPVIKYVFKK